MGGRRGEAIRQALADQLGLTALEVEPFGLSGSAGSTPLRIQVQGEDGTTRHVFGKLYARSHLRADRSYKLGRALLYGRLEDEKPFNTVKRLVQQEDYALALMQRAGLPSPEPYGVAELTPEREYLIVFEFIDGAKEIGDAEVDDAIIDQGLGVVRKLWDANLAHRDIKPANLLVRDGKLYLIDVFFAEIHPSPWRQAVDLANMMLCLALRSSPQQVYQRALQHFTRRRDHRGVRRRPRAGTALPAPQDDARPGTQPGTPSSCACCPSHPARSASSAGARDASRSLLLVLLALIPAAVPLAWVFARSSANPGGAAAVTGGTGSCTQIEELWLQAQAVPSASPHPLRPGAPRRRRRRPGCPRRRVGARARPRQPRHLPQHRRRPRGAHRSRQRDDPAHGNVRRPDDRGGADRRAGRPTLPAPRTRQHSPRWSTCSPAAVSPTSRQSGIGPSAPLLDQAQRAVTYRTRDDLREALRRRSDGRLQLDPEDRTAR